MDVTDASAHTIAADITLDEPLALKVAAAPYTYPGGLNISCHNCYNGSITPSVLQGVAPYSYLWSDGSTAPVRTNLGSASYSVTVTDANGCEASAESMFLQEPERSDWTMTGNAGTNPAVQYIGTSDNTDVVFKANGQVALRLKGNGDISLLGNLTGDGPLFRGADGKLRVGGDEALATLTGTDCWTRSYQPYWNSTGNAFAQICPDFIPRLGTLTPVPLKIITNNIQRMVIALDGKVGIGTTPPTYGTYKLFVEGGISTRDVLVKTGVWPDYVFDPVYTPMPLDELRSYLDRERHLPGIPSAADLAANNGVQLGDMQRRLVQVVEEQALYILQLEERLKAVEQRLDASNPTK